MTDRVYFVGTDDGGDDPAYGFSPIKEGPTELIAAWLRTQAGLDQLSVMRADGRSLWARDYLREAGD